MLPTDPIRSPPDARPRAVSWLAWGAVAALAAALVGGRALRANGGAFYRDLALALPLGLVGMSRAAPHRWGCTIMATVYAVVMMALVGVMAASPSLMPLAYKLGHVVPPAFPLLLLAPAVALDLLRRLSPRWRLVGETLAVGALVAAALAIVRAPLGGPAYGPLTLGALVARVAR